MMFKDFSQQRILIFLRRHVAAIVIAVLVGFLYTAPVIYFASQPQYQGIYMSHAADEVAYMTTINKSYASVLPVGNPYLYEYRDARNPFQYFAVEFVLGKIGSLFHLSIAALALITKFIFPALLALVIYTFGVYLSGNRLTAIVVSVAVLLGNELARPNIFDLVRTLMFHSSFTDFLLYSRPVNPQVSAIFFFATLLSLAQLLRNPRSKWAIGVAGVMVSSLAYIYFFFWAFAVALLGVMFVYALIAYKRTLIIATMLAGVIGIIISAPFLKTLFLALSSSGGSILTQAVPSHQVIIEKMVLLPVFLYACIFLWGWWSRGQGKMGEWSAAFAHKYLFIFLLLITGIIVSNQQVLTGKLLQQHHFHFFTNIPLFLLSTAILFGEAIALVKRMPRAIAAGVFFIIIFWHAAAVQTSSYRMHYTEYVRYQNLAPLFSWLNTHASTSVVLANISTDVEYQLTMYTQQFLYTSIYDSSYIVPPERVRHGYFVMLALRGVTADSVRSYVYETKNREEIGVMLFGGQYWRDLCGTYGCFPDSILEELIPQYQTFASRSLVESLHKYKIDYVLIDRADDKWDLRGIAAGSPIYTSGDFALYAAK